MTDLGGLTIKEDHRWLNFISYSGGPGAPEYDWCSLANCLRDFKVTPSTPHQSAFGASAVMAWMQGFRVLDWLAGAFNIVTFGFWWHSFAVLAMDPQQSSPISILSWVLIWQFAILLNFHPFACRFDMQRGRGRFVVWAVAFVALAHITVLSDNFNSANEANREGPVAYDVQCNALHVPFSPWKYFLDVGDSGRAMRVPKMWLNA
ncbi:hypothetical protein K458DRAFT_395152 [Lentithecium fluviatile CBS 122367]|uniref:Uncharacterized protein n=1 Tax=Lentithecium fluviatile CBS 122367 TaxID=1168545 RepID=A0A6G1IJE1_9PLEO|nr:hypothetical protein K458DRAFT_395152 [Lentithecium fluviatile CBS 122367]